MHDRGVAQPARPARVPEVAPGADHRTGPGVGHRGRAWGTRRGSRRTPRRTRGTWVWWSITSETRIAQRSRVSRQGRSWRPWCVVPGGEGQMPDRDGDGRSLLDRRCRAAGLCATHEALLRGARRSAKLTCTPSPRVPLSSASALGPLGARRRSGTGIVRRARSTPAASPSLPFGIGVPAGGIGADHLADRARCRSGRSTSGHLEPGLRPARPQPRPDPAWSRRAPATSGSARDHDRSPWAARPGAAWPPGRRPPDRCEHGARGLVAVLVDEVRREVA